MVNSSYLQRLISASSKRLHKSDLGLMNETINPLWNIDEKKAQVIFDVARSGNYAWLQYIYNEIEERDPTLLVCVTRRTSALAELDWRVVRSDQRLNRNVDEGLVKAQIEYVETEMAKIDNLPDAIEHLALSAFRGFSMVAPVRDTTGSLKHLDLIDNWNLCYNKAGQSWYFNPSGSSFTLPASIGLGDSVPQGLEYIPPEMVCVVTRNRPIDWPALQIYLRAAVGERDWGRFLETYGLPPVIITMPEFTSKEDEELYVAAAEQVFEGRSGVVPYGSQISYGSESRGVNPFTEFIEHQMKLIVLMSTGGTLASLAESGSGTLAGEAQQDEWLRIVRADKRIISNAINKQICERLIKGSKEFAGKPILAEFQLDATPKPTAKEMLELAGMAATAGLEMDLEELSQACGFTLRKKVESGGMGFNASSLSNPAISVAAKPENTVVADNAAQNASKTVSTPSEGADKVNTPLSKKTPQNAATAGSTQGSGNTPADAVANDALSDLAGALQTDFKDIADRLNSILALSNETEQRAAAMALIGDIDKLVPEDPEMAAVIAEQMEAAFDRQIAKEPTGAAPTANKAIPNSK